MLRNSIFVVGCLTAACANEEPVEQARSHATGSSDVSDETGGSEQDTSETEPPPPVEAPAPELAVHRTPKECPHAFEPSLAALDPPLIQPKNSARRVQSLRNRLERVDVIEASTHRVLFSVDDDETVAALRRSLAGPPIIWARNTRTASLPAWPVALLFYVSRESRPFLGWFFDDGDVYFVDERDPWDYAVFEPDGETLRDVFSIPTNEDLADALSDEFGEYDPLDQLRRSAQRREDVRCGRVSQPHGETFPDLPRAIVERPNTDEPCFDLSLVAEDLKVLDLGKGAALRLRGGPYDFRHLVSDAPLNDGFRTFSFCGLVEGQRYDLTLERSEGAKPEVLSEAASLDSFIQGLGTPEYRPVPISIHMPRPPELREEDEDENSDE